MRLLPNFDLGKIQGENTIISRALTQKHKGLIRIKIRVVFITDPNPAHLRNN